jgi:hypothetical protein
VVAQDFGCLNLHRGTGVRGSFSAPQVHGIPPHARPRSTPRGGLDKTGTSSRPQQSPLFPKPPGPIHSPADAALPVCPLLLFCLVPQLPILAATAATAARCTTCLLFPP